MSRQLIVNADDFSRSSEVNRGILDAHHRGIVTTTTALINMPDAVQAIQEASHSAPELGIGLHLNLTLGKPCSQAQLTSALVGEDGHFQPINDWHESPQDIPIQLIEAEWRTQIETFISSGIRIDHLDSHHHIATVREDIWQLYLDLAGELGVGVRPPYPDDVNVDELGQSFPDHMLENARRRALPALKQSSIPHPATFLASFFDEHANLNHLLNLLKQIPAGISELMCHPGYLSSSLEVTSSYAHQRVVELESLTDPKTIQMIKDLEIDLVTYQQAWQSS